jgi:hypothetical protein
MEDANLFAVAVPVPAAALKQAVKAVTAKPSRNWYVPRLWNRSQKMRLAS